LYGWDNLKKEIIIENNKVTCPVQNCQEKFDKMIKYGHNLQSNKKNIQKYLCKNHNIYISPSTFRYDNVLDNILWKKDFKVLFKSENVKKRFFDQFDHDNSEDSLSYNIFRFIEKYDLLSDCLSKLINSKISNPEIMYWSYSQTEQKTWSELQDARIEFETRQGSEPDIIVKSDTALFFIEVKLNADNKTVCKSMNPRVHMKYKTGGNNWFSSVFNSESDFKTIAIVEKKYELLRFWLLGTWIAKQNNLNFYLINLVRNEKEKNIEEDFRKYIKGEINGENKRIFKRITWNEIYNYISNHAPQNNNKSIILKYFENKTIGYRKIKNKRILQKAFSI
jgi:Holliday junction resolvase-like predicted endonuclease